MYNRTPYNRTAYNRASSIVFEWLANASAGADSSGVILVTRHFNGAVEAVAAATMFTPSIVIVTEP